MISYFCKKINIFLDFGDAYLNEPQTNIIRADFESSPKYLSKLNPKMYFCKSYGDVFLVHTKQKTITEIERCIMKNKINIDNIKKILYR